MPRTCTACLHPDRPEIDHALVRGTAYRTIAKQYGLSDSAAFRHQREHLPKLLAEAAEAEEVAHADTLLAEVRSLHARTLSLLDAAEQAGDLSVALRAIREARGNVELLARLAGELQEGTTVNVLVTPQWVEVRTVILRALDPHPAAKLAVSEALRRAAS